MSIDTAPDAALHGTPDLPAEVAPDLAADGASDGWLVEQRGSFFVGRCDTCGHTTAARRARFSMETDMLRHGAECGEPQAAVADPRA